MGESRSWRPHDHPISSLEDDDISTQFHHAAHDLGLITHQDTYFSSLGTGSNVKGPATVSGVSRQITQCHAKRNHGKQKSITLEDIYYSPDRLGTTAYEATHQ
jgi:hypothetical protein